MDMSIRFPHLGIYLPNVGKTISVFGFDIAYYGITIAIAMIVGISIALHEAKRTGQNQDTYLDLLMLTMLTSVLGARIYYVIFSWDNYKDNLGEILNIRNGGLAIYGGIIAGVITVFIYSKIKKMKFLQIADTVCMGLAAAALVRKIAENYKLPYYTISPTYSVCKEHGYISGEHFTCPKCGKKAEVYSRITGYYRPVQNWNDGKAQEYKNLS